MSRTIFLSLNESEVVARCQAEKVGVSVIERLPGGGVRLVCMSSDGAERIRTKLRTKLIQGDPQRARYRPSTPLW
jgi:hypothetical protein